VNRRFSARQRVALFLAAGGRSTGCGAPPERSWPADHVTPWSAGGPTDVINGQALCPSCNRMKGTNEMPSSRPTGTSADAALRRLRKQRPDLHAQVLAGQLSPHAAAVEAGFRRRRISVPADDPERAVAALARHFSADELMVAANGIVEHVRR
jgi:hypothetical protein